MKQFLLLLHEDIEKMSNLSPKEMEKLANAHMAWAEKLAESGHLISGDGLQEKGVLISGQDAVIKDGPYLESKEIIGGYYLLKAENIETIVEIARECPCHIWGGTTEVRQIMEMEDYEQSNCQN
ncbi:YciI family protein [Flavobacterium sp. U410]